MDKLNLALKPVYIIWMRFVFVLGWISARLLLLVVFYLVFTPTALIIRLFGKDLLDMKIDKNRPSYWHKKESKAFSRPDYERQF